MKQVGLSLGGGGAKGLAHIGVLKYLDERGVQISEVSGTSMGAIIGAMVAFGKDWREIRDLLEHFQYRKYVDISLRIGFLKGRKIQHYLAELFENKTIGEANIPLTIIACDIDTGEEYVFGPDTPVDLAVRASFSIPTVFAPVEFDDKKLVDGGLVNNIPVDKLTEDTRIASSVVAYNYPIIEQKVLFGFFRRRKAFITMAREYLRKSYAILQNKGEQLILERTTDATIHLIKTDPTVQFHDFMATEQAVHHGYVEAKQTLKDISFSTAGGDNS